MPWRRDALGAMLIIALTGLLLSGARIDQRRHFVDVVGQTFSAYLLQAMGFAAALRMGAIDLSVWAVAALGGTAGVLAFRCGVSLAGALLVAAAVGALVGALNGVLVGKLRLPSPIVTLASAVIIVVSLQAGFDSRQILLPQSVLESWPVSVVRPPLLLRIELVAGTYLAVLLLMSPGLLLIGRRRGKQGAAPGLGLFVALVGSGTLASLAGAIWLLEHGWSPVPTRVIGDLRIPAAAILAGGALFAGRGRGLLVTLCLPAAVLASTLWRSQVMHLPCSGYYLQMVLLAGMTIVTHLAMLQVTGPDGRPWPGDVLCLALAAGGQLMLAAGTGTPHQGALNALGLAAWTAGALLLVVSRVLRRRRSAARPG